MADNTQNTDTSFDYIVVGGGTAGCALASRLSVGNGSIAPSVAVIERGSGSYDHDYIKKPLLTAMLGSTDLQTPYKTEPQEHLGGRRITNIGGNVLSGSSAVNYGAWTRGHAADYDAWADILGDPRWNYENMLPCLKRTEHHHDSNADAAKHGFHGPLHTTSGRGYPLRDPIHKAFLTAGFKDNPDGNDGDPFGVAPWAENWRDGERQPSAKAYDMSKVTVITDAQVRRVLLEGGEATGVELVDGRQFKAAKEVIVSCGTHRTPQVLMLSGIGPKDELEKIGVTPLIDSPFVGQNFFDHISIGQVWKLRNPEQNLAMGTAAFMENPNYHLGNPMEWVATGTVPKDGLSAALSQDRDSVEAAQAKQLVDDRAHYEIIAIYAPLGIGDGYNIAVDGTHITTGSLCFTPTSRGSITLKNADPTEHPQIDPNYYATKSDRYVLHYAMRRAMQVMETPEMQKVVEGETPPPNMPSLSSKSSDAELEARAKAHANIWNHPAGTCAMGKVLDSELRVKGVEGLRVCDASIFPAPLSAHYQAPVYAIAEKASELIIGAA
ncbi:MAG: hypothetical protein M1828_000405 [Chrysothrix sp. TS-e1954]|nr:MAG: hypothetical protein M1828_000405 [Chrysothrix sp. TS-e1954]